MRRLLFALLLGWSCLAYAAPPPCYPVISSEAVFRADWFARTNNGWYFFWFCKRPDDAYESHGMYCSHGLCNQNDWSSSQIEIGASTNKRATADALYEKLVTQATCSPDTAATTPVCGELLTAIAAARAVLKLPAPQPPGSEVWKVKASGTSKTRVVYTLRPDLTRGPLTSPLISVTVGTVCDPTVKIVESGVVYMKVDGGVAVCEKQ